MDTLLPLAARCGEALKRRKETIAIAESSAGGLIAAALLAVPGASAYFVGGAVVYTKQAREALLGITLDDLERQKMRPATEAYAMLLARTARTRFGTTWALAETGATGPTGNRYGDAAGHACIALVMAASQFAARQPELLGGAGTSVPAGDSRQMPYEKAVTIETGSPDRQANMRAFAKAALELLAEKLEA